MILILILILYVKFNWIDKFIINIKKLYVVALHLEEGGELVS